MEINASAAINDSPPQSSRRNSNGFHTAGGAGVKSAQTVLGRATARKTRWNRPLIRTWGYACLKIHAVIFSFPLPSGWASIRFLQAYFVQHCPMLPLKLCILLNNMVYFRINNSKHFLYFKLLLTIRFECYIPLTQIAIVNNISIIRIVWTPQETEACIYRRKANN